MQWTCLLIAKAYNLPLNIFNIETNIHPSKRLYENPHIKLMKQANQYIFYIEAPKVRMQVREYEIIVIFPDIFSPKPSLIGPLI
jgi:hypothetical protein